jgi:hypothetical protein
MAITHFLNFLKGKVQERLHVSFNVQGPQTDFEDRHLPDFTASDTPLSIFIKTHALTPDEIITLLIALVPHVQTDFFDNIIASFFDKPTDFPQIGGTRGKQFRGFLPTGETVQFILAGDDLEKRFAVQQLFKEDHLFAKKQILWLDEVPEGEPLMAGRLILSPEIVELLTLGKVSSPRFSTRFPAERVETLMNWQDLILPSATMQQLEELLIWLAHHEKLMTEWQMQRHLKPGYRALFYGSPGTGKTLTAALLGKHTKRNVFRVDLSMVVSKFIGETEKNLSNLFDKAENKDWILFFDEADALFGKRTSVRDAHDRYANQEVSYLLQRVETYNGLVILASNFKSNIDDAFLRRFQSIIHFPMPRMAERLRLWHNILPKDVKLDPSLNLKTIAEKYELSGAVIVNIVQFCCLRAIKRQDNTITEQDILQGIAREFAKEGKIL